MRDCVHNEEIGLRNRYLRDIGQPESYDTALVDEILVELAGLIKQQNGGALLEIPTLHEFYESRTGHSKQRLGKALQTVADTGFDPLKCSKIKAFIKNEKYSLDELTDPESQIKDPRIIMGRDPRFGLIYGRFTTALEKIVKHVKGFDKGDTFFDMGKFIEEHPSEIWSYYYDDASKFESSQREKLLRHVECGLMKLILKPEDYQEFMRCFEVKMIKQGFTRHGLEFLFYALRCSGEFDTWLFNTILNWVAHRYFEKKNKSGNIDFITTGDDGVGAHLRNKKMTLNTFPEFGFDCTLEFVRSPTDLEFCSSKFVEYYPGKWMLCPNIPKLLRNIGFLINPDFNNCIGHYYYSLGYMYRIMFPGFPFFDQLSKFLMNITQNKRVRFVQVEHLKYLNPMYVEVFKNGKTTVEFSEKLFKIGIQMAYSLLPSELDHVYDYFDTTEVDVSHRDNRFNKKGASAPTFSAAQCQFVQERMDASMINSLPNVLSFVKRLKEDPLFKRKQKQEAGRRSPPAPKLADC